MSDITDERMATALERIADALEGAHPAKFNPGGLIQPPWDIASVPNRVELEPVPNQPGVFRRVTHAAWDDCERPADPLDESDHRTRHDRDGDHWFLRDGWSCNDSTGLGLESIRAVSETFGPLAFCDCDTIEAENGATD